MIKKFTLTCLLIWLAAFRLGAQTTCNFKITGQVFDLETKEPLPFVTIQIEGTTQGTKSDLEGYFVISDLCQEEVHLVFSHLGYKSTIHHHDPYHKNPKIFMATDDLLLESVVIESGRITGDLASIKANQLSEKEYKRYNSSSFAEAASKITGVNMLTTGQNIAKPIIHGLHSNRVLIINNGLRHEFQNWGSEHAPEIDPSLFNSLEVIKGAGTVRYGPDALGGVILINPPKLGLDKPLNGEAGIKYNTNGRSYENNIKIQQGFHRFSLIGQASYIRQGDLSAPDYLLSNTGKEELSYAVGGLYHFPKMDLQVDYSRFNQELGILRGSVTGSLSDLATAIERTIPAPTTDFTYDINNPRQRIKHDLFKIKNVLNHNGQTFNMQYGYQKNRRQEFDIRRGTNNVRPSINLELASHSLDLDWKKSNKNGLTQIIGTQFSLQENRNIPGTNTAHFIPDYDQYRGGVFIIEALEKGQNTFELGARYDYQFTAIRGRDQAQDLYTNELSFQNFTFTIGYKREISKTLSFNTNLGSAWRPPNVSELYAFGKHEFSINYGLWRYQTDENNNIVTNEVLTENDRAISPEKGLKWIGTLSYFNQKIDTEFTLFANYIQNFINARPRGVTNTVRGAFPFFVYEQSNAMLLGADFSLKYNHSKILNSHFRGSYLNARDVSNNSFYVGLPPANLAYELNYEHTFIKAAKANFSLSVSYNFQQFQAPDAIAIRDFIEGNVSISPANDDFDFLPPPEGFFLVNAYWSTEISKFEVALAAKNLLNNSYRAYTNSLRYFSDETGRNISVAVKYQF